MATATKKKSEGQATMLPISKIYVPENTRETGWEKKITELAASIKANGLVCPIMVTPMGADENGHEFELVYGSRRLAACQKLKHTTIKSFVGSSKLTNKDKFIMKLVENKDREDLTPLEEAKAYRRAIDEHNLTAKQLAKTIGKTDGHVSQRLALLKMPEKVQEAVADGTISSTHAREINRIKDPKEQEKLVEKAAKVPGPQFKEMIDEKLSSGKKSNKKTATTKTEKAATSSGGDLKVRRKEVKVILGKMDKALKAEADKYKKAHLKGFMLGAAWATKISGAKLPVRLD